MEVRQKPPTIWDVAGLSGVSKSTVSNVLTGSSGVSTRTRRRVTDAIARLGYRPNVLARQLVRQRTTTLGVVVGDLANPFYGEMAKLVEQHAAERGYTAMFCNTDGDPGRELARLENLLQHRVAGIVFLSFTQDLASIGNRLPAGLHTVFLSCNQESADSVAVDDRRGAEMATRHLIELGHRVIAYVTTPLVEERAHEARLAGFRQALSLAGLAPAATVRWQPPSGIAQVDGRSQPLRDLFSGGRPVTAVFASNDFAAIDLMEAADQLKLRVPDDLSVVGFDDISLARLARIGLTTVAQPRQDLVRIGIEILISRIEGRLTGPPRYIMPDAALMVRSSTAAPPSHREHGDRTR
jgi:LacI family transcriptional regulator